MHDIVVIGAGPAGLTAAIYARRAGKSVAVLEKASFGGQITHSPKIENYPGFTEISGTELADRMTEQALFQGVEIELETVTGIEKSTDGFTVVTEDDAQKPELAVQIADKMIQSDQVDILTGIVRPHSALPPEATLYRRNVIVMGSDVLKVEPSGLASCPL